MHRRRSLGAEVTPAGVHFRVWAPSRREVAVVIDDRNHPLERESDGYFSGSVPNLVAGSLYRFRLDGASDSYPDPASRLQPEGPHGPSQVVDPSSYAWRDHTWSASPPNVIYELHIGTFTREGTYEAARRRIPYLAELGIDLLEVMPIHEFPGRFGWGYDGVDLWAPSRLYGEPDDFRAFVDDAHAHGIGVILDVVYNHFGPDGCYLAQFSPTYFTRDYVNEWGAAVNFDGPGADGVRELVAENAAYWIDEFHLDGLRLDATQSIHDRSPKHILTEIAERARKAAGNREIFLSAENEPQDRRVLTEYGLDAMWNDDWHHSARVALTGFREAYYTDYRGTAREFVSMAKHGFLYQGQRYSWQEQRRGTPSLGIAPERMICCLENHDQVANSARGARLRDLASPGALRAMTALLLLQPATPMLFQGQECGARAPFLYFADHEPALASLVAKGRFEFLAQFPSFHGLDFAAPHEQATFESCQLDDSDRDERVVALHRDLLAIRRQQPLTKDLDGTALTDECLLLRATDHLLLVNLGPDLHLPIANEPLLAPPLGSPRWTILWSSENPAYGGSGMSQPDTDDGWRIRGQAAVLMVPAVDEP
jgi:maltooligosyltrehalose trehalohydrolase